MSRWNDIGVILGLVWGYFRVILAAHWHYFVIWLESIWGRWGYIISICILVLQLYVYIDLVSIENYNWICRLFVKYMINIEEGIIFQIPYLSELKEKLSQLSNEVFQFWNI